jgi:hypothetical protein
VNRSGFQDDTVVVSIQRRGVVCFCSMGVGMLIACMRSASVAVKLIAKCLILMFTLWSFFPWLKLRETSV